jgi:hypothetical protein
MPEYRVFREARVTTTILIDADSPQTALEEARSGDHHWKDYEAVVLVTRVVDPCTRDLLIAEASFERTKRQQGLRAVGEGDDV